MSSVLTSYIEKPDSKNWLYRVVFHFLLFGLVIMAGWIIAGKGLPAMATLIALPLLFGYLALVFKYPQTGIISIIIMGFAISGLSRYIKNIPFGLSIDFLLVITFLAALLKQFRHFDLKPALNGATLAIWLWFGYCVFELFNPLARSTEAWFYAVRGLAMWMAFFIPLAFLLFSHKKHLKWTIRIWMFMSLLGTLWGIKQFFFGVTATEQAWLDAGAANTHVLFGRLRVFSFYSDAGQFGAAQAHTALVAGIIALGVKSWKKRIVFFLMALLSFYGLAISGTRGALAVIAIGGFVYLFLSKRFLIFAIGILLALSGFVFLKYTYIGQSNYQIQRMRSALDPNDPSFQVRKNREKVLKVYMADKPIGEGIGSAGSWGKRFSPGTFLAELGTDSHYVRVWAECGIVGLLLHLAILAFLFAKGFWIIWRFPDCPLRNILVALYSGFAGVAVASYTNGVITQLPTGILIDLSIVYIFAAQYWKPGIEKFSPIKQ